ncbi:MAG TPA: hypothetical protein VGH53_30890 [Streptosporangiaceae bacterium]
MAVVKRIASEYHVSMAGTELALIRSALGEAERVPRFGIDVLDEADRSGDGNSSENCRLHLKIDALATREALLRSLRKTMSEVDHGGKPAPSQHAALDKLVSAASPLVPQPRWFPDA